MYSGYGISACKGISTVTFFLNYDTFGNNFFNFCWIMKGTCVTYIVKENVKKKKNYWT